MEYRFQLIKIEASLKDKCVHLTFALDLDEDTVTDNIWLMSQKPSAVVPCDVITDGRTVDLKLNDWPVPEKNYTLVINPGKIKSITDETLETLVPYTVVFHSEVTSTVKILSPDNFAEMDDSDDIALEWQETGKELIRKYRVEIASDSSFVNIIQKASIDKAGSTNTSFKAVLPRPESSGQYYIRLRAENDSGYGPWSDTVSIVFPVKNTEVPNPQPEKEKERPGEPEIVDLVKDSAQNLSSASVPAASASAATASSPQSFTYDDDLPEKFEIPLDEAIDIADATIVLKRKAI